MRRTFRSMDKAHSIAESRISYLMYVRMRYSGCCSCGSSSALITIVSNLQTRTSSNEMSHGGDWDDRSKLNIVSSVILL